MTARFSERGGANLVGIVVAAVMLIIVTGLGLGAFQSSAAASQSQIKIMRAQFGMNEFWDMAQSDAGSSESVFVPSHDVFGQANGYTFGDGHPLAADTSSGIVAAPGTTGHELDFYGKDAFHHPHFWAYVFRNGVVAKYTYAYRDSNGLAVGLASAPTWSLPASSFKSYYLYASQVSSVNSFVQSGVTASGSTLRDVLTAAPFPEVFMGNRLAVYDIVTVAGNSHGSQHVELLGGVGGGTRSLPVSYTPMPASGFSVTPTSMTLGYQGANGLASTGSFAATVANYHRDLQLGTCAIASVSRSSEQLSQSGETSGYAVNPTAVGNCSETIGTVDGSQSATVQITVQGALSVTPSYLEFSSSSAANQGAALAEPGYSGAFTVLANGCSGYAQMTGGGNGPGPVGLTIQPQATTFALNGHVCTIVFADAYGSQGYLNINVDPPAATPSPSPTPALCNQSSPCLFMRYAVGDGATYENADCQVGANQDCHGSYAYTVVDGTGRSIDVSALANDAIAQSDANGTLYTPGSSPPAPAGVPGESACQSKLWQTATDQGRNGNDNGQGAGAPFWFQFLLDGSSPYSLGVSLNGYVSQDAAGWSDGSNQITGVTC